MAKVLPALIPTLFGEGYFRRSEGQGNVFIIERQTDVGSDEEESGHQPMSRGVAVRATGAKSTRFKHAALAYLVYGVAYEGWAVYALYVRGLPV